MKSKLKKDSFVILILLIFFQNGNSNWNSLDAPDTLLYPWDEKSTYIKSPPFFNDMVSRLTFIFNISSYLNGTGILRREVRSESVYQRVDDNNIYVFLQTYDLPEIRPIKNAAVLLNLGDSVTTDHISPAGSISRTSPAARYLSARG